MATAQVQSNGYHGKSLSELQALFDANKRPGRPSPEQRALKEYIEALQNGSVQPEPATKRRRGKKSPVVEDTDDTEVDNDEEDTKKKGKKAKVTAPKSTTVEIITIPPIKVGVIPCVVHGTEPLIMHAWDVKSKRQIEEKQQKKAGRGQREARDPQAEYNAARYVDSKGRDCIPARHFKNSMIESATFLDDVTKKEIKGAIYVKGDLLPILDMKGKPMKPQMRDDMVRIGGMSKVADIRYRPMYPNWQVKLEIEFEQSVFSPEQVINLLNRAGFHVGVGEWRPTFGRFAVAR